MSDDVGIEFVARDAYIACIHQSSKRNNSDICRTSSDIDDHMTLRFLDRNACTDSREDRLFDYECAFGTCADGRFDDSAAFGR